MKNGVLVVGHGSKLDYNKKLVEYMARKMDEMEEFGPVTASFMQINTPSIMDGIKTLVAKGVDTIYVQPCFLASGIHLTEDIPSEIGLKKGNSQTTTKLDGKQVTLKYCDPIGEDDRIAQILADRVRSRMKKA